MAELAITVTSLFLQRNVELDTLPSLFTLSTNSLLARTGVCTKMLRVLEVGEHLASKT